LGLLINNLGLARGQRDSGMSDLLQTLLAERDYLVADGATGTNLFEAGLMTGDSPELWNEEYPDRIAELHRSMVEAGADIILANTFGCNRYRMALHGAQGRVTPLNVAGARIARDVADAAGRPVVVAGSMGPTGEIYQPVGPLSIADGSDAFAEQARALADGGVDVLWIETMSGKEELEAAVAGAAVTGLPIVATMTFDTNGFTMMGLAPDAAIQFAHTLDTDLAAFGSNCGIGPAALVDSVLGISGAASAGDVVVAKGNCGIPEYHDGHIHYSPRRRRAHHRRLLRHLADASAGNDRGAGGPRAGPAPRPRRYRGETGPAGGRRGCLGARRRIIGTPPKPPPAGLGFDSPLRTIVCSGIRQPAAVLKFRYRRSAFPTKSLMFSSTSAFSRCSEPGPSVDSSACL
jgi:5-methyltetrahydrofolate--homocysteine methyltransferase